MFEPEKASDTKHPFILEKLYRMIADATTNGDISDPEKVLAPLLNMYFSMRDNFFKEAYKAAPPEQKKLIEEQYERPWWETMPLTLPPYQSHHELSLMYAQYRLMTSGNMTFLVGRDLGEALFNTDFSLRMADIHFPADTFTIYYRDSQIPVGPSVLKWLFVDRVTLSPHRSQLRVIFGYVDEDDDWANSDFFFFDYQADTEIKSDELFQMIDAQDVSDLSHRKITDEHRRNSRNILTALFNFLLYIGITDDLNVVRPPDYRDRLERLQNPKKRRRLQKQVADETLFRYTYIGQSYEKKVSDAPEGDGSALDHRVLVRGHWRHQWFGRQRDEDGNRIPGTSQKLIWVEPYWKGPDVHDEKVSVRVVR